MNHVRAKSMHGVANGFQYTLGRLRQNARPWHCTSILCNSSAPAKENALKPPSKEEEEEEEAAAITIDQRQLPADYDPATFDPTEHRRPPTERVFRLVDEVADLTLLEVSDLTDLIMKKLGINEKPAMTMMMPGAVMPGVPGKPGSSSVKEEKKPAKTSFDLKLDSYEAASKIKIIKEVRTFTDLGLKEAKELVEKTPALLKKGVSKEEGSQTGKGRLHVKRNPQFNSWHLASTFLDSVACLSKIRIRKALELRAFLWKCPVKRFTNAFCMPFRSRGKVGGAC